MLAASVLLPRFAPLSAAVSAAVPAASSAAAPDVRRWLPLPAASPALTCCFRRASRSVRDTFLKFFADLPIARCRSAGSPEDEPLTRTKMNTDSIQCKLLKLIMSRGQLPSYVRSSTFSTQSAPALIERGQCFRCFFRDNE
ncbi:hypothetical protein GQ42DRAFT_173576 [Ramicandelaber brevisporus]|nr:hypothetical protein GQ42DRAFT_173576 [Ramicandelaber brevisporus]